MGGVVEFSAHNCRNAFPAFVTLEPLVRVVGGDGALGAEAGAGAVRTGVGVGVKSGSFHRRLQMLTDIIYKY
jgi:hypothetical protein